MNTMKIRNARNTILALSALAFGTLACRIATPFNTHIGSQPPAETQPAPSGAYTPTYIPTSAPTSIPTSEVSNNGCLPSIVLPAFRFDGRNGDDLTTLYNAIYGPLGISSKDKIIRLVLNDELNQLEALVNSPSNNPIRVDVSDAQMKNYIAMTSGYDKENVWYTSTCLSNSLGSQGKNINGLAELIAQSYSAKMGGLSAAAISNYISAGDIFDIQPNSWSDADTDPAVITVVPRDAKIQPMSIPLTYQKDGKTKPDYALLAEIQGYLGLPK